MNKEAFKEGLLGVMERKRHWAWSGFTSGLVPKELLHIHLEQEYATYVRDFPVLIGWAFVQCPVAAVRRELAENLFEEETGGLVAGRPHPELFLEYPRGLGMDLSRFESVELLPESAAYRARLDRAVRDEGWEVAAAVSTIFVEGTPYERGEVDSSAPRRPSPPLEDHPLVKHYGLPLESLKLTKAHRQVEGDHRASAWHVILDFVEESGSAREKVIGTMNEVLDAWLSYRDGVSRACGLKKAPDGSPARM